MNVMKDLGLFGTLVINSMMITLVLSFVFGFVDYEVDRSGEAIQLNGYKAAAAFQLATRSGTYGTQSSEQLKNEIESIEEGAECGLNVPGFDDSGKVRIGMNDTTCTFEDKDQYSDLTLIRFPMYSPGIDPTSEIIGPSNNGLLEPRLGGIVGIPGFGSFETQKGFYNVTVGDERLEPSEN